MEPVKKITQVKCLTRMKELSENKVKSVAKEIGRWIAVVLKNTDTAIQNIDVSSQPDTIKLPIKK